jgi:hypothetical protein
MANLIGQTIHEIITKLEDLYLEKNYEEVVRISLTFQDQNHQ